MSVCASCGFESPAGFAFCGKCGAVIGVAPAAPPPAARSERRQLTVLFCDVVDSAVLAGRLDPEDLREVLRAYHDAAGAVIGRFGGHTAQVLGDGLLVYFGYPVAHEDDARRAVHSALELLAEVTTLGARLLAEQGLRFAVRFGIHTGPVVAGDVSVGTSRENLAVGQTPNIAARLQGLAGPDTILVSGATYRLVRRFFECESLGPQQLKGISTDVDVYRVLRESDVVSPFDMASIESLAPMVGRTSELNQLADRFERARGGAGNAVLVLGEAGVGKSRLLQQFREDVAATAPRLLSCAGSPYYEGSALHPVAGLVERLFECGTGSAETRVARLREGVRRWRLPDDDAVSLLAKLVSLPAGSYADSVGAPSRQRERTLDLLVSLFTEIARDAPTVFVIEDLHFVDPSTMQFVDALLKDLATTRMLLLCTARPGFTAWTARPDVTTLTLGRLTEDDVAALITAVAGGRELPAALLRRLAEKSDGVPLFAEELTKAVIESDPDGARTLDVPSSLQDSLTSRLDRLGPARHVAEVAAVLGREFGYELLRSVYDGPEDTLQTGLTRLEQAELMFARGVPPNAAYLFKHALVQDAAYNLLLKSARRDYHRRTADALTSKFPATAESHPGLVAHHFTEAGAAPEAIDYWQRAGERAWEQSANLEGIQGLQKAVALLPSVPRPRRDRLELGIHTQLGRALSATKGYADAEVGEVYNRALALCDQEDDSEQRFWAYDGLHSYFTVRGELERAALFAARMLERAQAADDPALLLDAHYKVGAGEMFCGRYAVAHEHMERAVELGTVENSRRLAGPDKPAAYSRSLSSAILWMLGFPDQARARAYAAITVARELGHVQSVVGAQVLACNWALNLCDERAAIRTLLAEAIPTAHTCGLSWWLAFGCIAQAHTDLRDGNDAATSGQALAIVQQTVGGLHAGGADLGRPIGLCVIGYGLQRRGDFDGAAASFREALACAARTGQHYWDAEAHRFAGELTIEASGGSNLDEAEACFLRAIDVARAQGARSFELRAALSLAPAWARRGRRADAHAFVSRLLDTFTEGHDTPDLQRAGRLLADLA